LSLRWRDEGRVALVGELLKEAADLVDEHLASYGAPCTRLDIDPLLSCMLDLSL
jgi:hypothetical protein